MSARVTINDIINTTSFYVDKYLLILGSYIERVPGGPIIVRYIKSSHKDDPIRTILEIILVIFAINYFTTQRYEVKKRGFVKLSDREVDELVDEWEPESLVTPLREEEEWKLQTLNVIEGPIREHVKINNQTLINLGSLNFLNLGINEKVKFETSEIVKQNGVGACGPPNFYGNQDIHIKLEQDLKRFFDSEGSVLYGQDFTTAGSVLPSFLKRGDYIIADSSVNVAIQKALLLSRATIFWFNHNDLDHLEEVLTEIKAKYFKNDHPISRKFIITEGLFQTTGDYPDLKRLVELKKRFKFRLFLDESLSFGVLGKTGRGLAEHYGVKRSDIDITISSMANAFCSSGAFCIGDNVMSYHQRIGSLAYCFSASLPAYVARATSTAIELIEENVDSNGNSKIISNLQHKNELLYDSLSKDSNLKKYFKITSARESSIVHLELNEKIRKSLNLPVRYTGAGSEMEKRNKKCISDKFIKSLNDEEKLLQKIINDLIARGVLIVRSTFSIQQETLPVLPHLKVCVNAHLSDAELTSSAALISQVAESVVGGLSVEAFESLQL